MNLELEQSIRSVLDMVMLLHPVSVRLVINQNIAHSSEEKLSLWYQGKTNEAFQETDSKFYGIMRTQKMIQIPSVERSFLLSNLSVGDAAAVFCPIQTEYGYYGVFWACFPQENYNERVLELFSSCCDWIISLLQNGLENDSNIQMIARRYADLLEQLNAPALIIVYPDQWLISNPCFESMKGRESILALIHEHALDDERIDEFCKKYHCAAKDIEFPGGKQGKLLIFKNITLGDSHVDFDTNAIHYYAMLVQKARGHLAMLDSTGELSNLQKSGIENTDTQLRRLETLFSFGMKHFEKLGTSGISAFEVISVSDIVRDVMLDLAALARTKRVALEMNTDKKPEGPSSGSAVGDAWLLTLAIYDLLENAIRFSRTDGRPIQINLVYAEKYWSLSVEDFGIGIAPLDLETIRDMSLLETIPEDESTLSGIPFVKYAVQIHRGTFTVESNLGKGSLFKIEIPYF